MALISPADATRLRDDFEKMTNPVTLAFFTQTFACDACPQVAQILRELTTLSDKIHVEELNPVLEPARAERFGIDHVPGIAVLAADAAGVTHDIGLRFVGVPSGYEFISLVHAILLAGGRQPELSADTLARLTALQRPMTIRVFTTPTCVYCPRAVNLAFELAAASPHITAFAVEVTGFPDLVRHYRVNGVPKTVVDDTIEVLGAVPEDEFVKQVLGEPGEDRGKEN